MPNSEGIPSAIKNIGSIDELISDLTGKKVEATLSSGSRLWGRLEWSDSTWLILRGRREQAITIRKKHLAALVEAV